ncbi:hypothetical protein [Cellulomonas oligotrophica]|uniref:Uncharacterized protein n=1 Tax=Cellulomonas oligotrophica TaxID=931536 RepID=A0A7Y9JYT0_9CELL|nr:hypothetical protein [Cellulomonas oligotrophica]NYD87122.1 hypothetical protein [Cellulomonas oligotrophica]GIG32092.1 hypothetical protein Col01nite_12510 [Cellulomonas oligotrophica]
MRVVDDGRVAGGRPTRGRPTTRRGRSPLLAALVAGVLAVGGCASTGAAGGRDDVVASAEHLAEGQDAVISDEVSGDERTEVELAALGALEDLGRAGAAAWEPRRDLLRVTIFLDGEPLGDDELARAQESVAEAVADAGIGTITVAVDDEAPEEY